MLLHYLGKKPFTLTGEILVTITNANTKSSFNSITKTVTNTKTKTDTKTI